MSDLLKQCVCSSSNSILANKTRSFLTMLGIIIGVGAVIVIMSVGAGAQSLILSQVESLGSNLVGILPGQAEENGPPASVMGIVITTLSYEDLQSIRNNRNVPDLVEAVGFSKSVASASWNSHTYDTNINGATSGYMEVEGGELEVGRFFNEAEERNLSRVAVLGSAVKKELFGDSDALGEQIKIKKQSFEVIGVMEERGTVAFQDYDDQIIIPLKTMQKLIAGVNHLSLIRAKIDKEENLEKAVADIEKTLRENHDIKDQSGAGDDFSVRSLDQALDVVRVITDGLKYFLAAMAALSLLVGGIGIMNIMLVNVGERTREIGLRKAVGADNENIMWQFLVESAIITFIGGVLGIIGGVLVSFLIFAVAVKLGYDWHFIITPTSIFLSFFVSIAVGVVFGLYPAAKAAKLNPIEALRYE